MATDERINLFARDEKEKPGMEPYPMPLQAAAQFRAEHAANQTIELRGKLERESVWAGLPEIRLQSDLIEANRLVTVNRLDPAYAAFDLVRTKVLQILREKDWTSVAITSPGDECGKSLVAANLAFSLAHQQDCRTLLVDLDLKEPAIARLLGIKDPPVLHAFLRGELPVGDVFRRHGENLALAANRRSVTYSSELLQSIDAGKALKAMRQTLAPDVILYDMPSMLSSDDVVAFLPNVDCAILVVAAEQTTFEELDVCERELSERTNLLGVVVNCCRPDTLS